MTGLLDAALAGRHEWRRRMRRGQAGVQADYNELVAESSVIRHFETAAVPGLIQTAGYAREMLRQAVRLGHLPEDDVDAAVAMRVRRQQALYDPAKEFEFLLCEPVLRWLPCSADVMRAQLDRLQTVIGMPNVRLAVAETFVNEGVCSVDESAAYARVLDLLWEAAVSGEDARSIIVAAVDAIRGRT